jgi:putative transposase
MAVYSFSVGVTVIIRDVSYKLMHKLEDGRFQFCQPDTSEIITLGRTDLLALYAEGNAEFAHKGLPTPSGATWYANYGDKPFSTYPEKDQQIALRREAYVKSVIAEGIRDFTKKNVNPVINKCAHDTEHPDERRPSWISVYRWRRRYLASGCDVRSLIDQRASQGRHQSTIDDRVRELVVQVLDEVYLTLERPSMVETRTALKHLIAIENKGRAPSKQLSCCSTKFMWKVLHEWFNAYTVVERRYGKLTAEREFRAALGRQERPTRLMQRVELDHVFLDLLVVDDETFIILGRPVIAIAIETLSRCVAGFHLGFDHPSAASVAACLKHAILPKSYIKATYPDIKNVWECFGNIETMVMDRALENLGRRVASASRQLGMDIEYNKRRSPWGKGIEERFNRTVSEDLIHVMPGTTFSNILKRGDYQPGKHALITKSAILELFHTWIIDVYHQSFHRGIHDSPAHKWQVAQAGCPTFLPRSSRDLDIALGMPGNQKLWHYGIEINKLKYNSEDLTELRRKIGNQIFVDFMWYSENLGCIDLLDPTTQRYIRVRCVDYEYAKGLTLYQHNLNLAYAKKNYNERTDMDALVAAKAALREIIKKCVIKSRGTSRKRQIRYLDGKGFTFGDNSDPSESNDAASPSRSSPDVLKDKETETPKPRFHHKQSINEEGSIREKAEEDYLDYEVDT